MKWINLCPLAIALAIGGCNPIGCIDDKLDSDYHHLSFGNGDYLRIHKRATDRMIEGYNACKFFLQWSDADCGREVLRQTRGGIRDSMTGPVKAAWDAVYHHAWNDGEGGDLATAIKDLDSRNHECLTAHFGWNWIISGPNWTNRRPGTWPNATSAKTHAPRAS